MTKFQNLFPLLTLEWKTNKLRTESEVIKNLEFSELNLYINFITQKEKVPHVELVLWEQEILKKLI